MKELKKAVIIIGSIVFALFLYRLGDEIDGVLGLLVSAPAFWFFVHTTRYWYENEIE